MVVSEYFASNLVMDETSKDVKEKQSTSKKSKPQAKSDKIRKRSTKKTKGQKDIRTLIKTKKNELLAYTKDFDLICKQSGIDVDPEQLQLAIALSKSLQDTKTAESDITEKSLTCNQRKNKIRTTLQEYGFQTKQAPGRKVNKKTKKYRKQYKLLLVSDTEKQKIIADKYSHILITNVSIFKTNEESLYTNNNIDSHLYKLTTNVTYDCIKDDEIFYVTDLVPKSLNKKHTFKDWSKIPGRPISPKLERKDINFEGANCSQEKLDNLLSGSIEIAQDVAEKNFKGNCIKPIAFEAIKDSPFSETDIKHQYLSNSKEDQTQEFCENKVEDHFISGSVDAIDHNISMNKMASETNRCYSPDLFDDEVTIIMDSPEEKVSAPEKVSDRTVTVKEQSDFMELTNCIGVVNSTNINSNQITCLSQGSNRTRSNSNDFMDLTECITACSQKTSNFKNTISHEKFIENYRVSDKSQPLDSANNINQCKKTLDDTIIMVDKEYSNINTGHKCKDMPNEIIIDLVKNQPDGTRKIKSIGKHSEAIIDLEHNNMNNGDFENNYPSNNQVRDSGKTNSDTHNCNSNEYSYSLNHDHLDVVDLTQPFKFQDRLSHGKEQSVESIDPCKIYNESENIPSNSVTSKNCDHYKSQENESKKVNNVEECNNLEAMDLTQSSNSDDNLEGDKTGRNKSLDDVTTLNNEQPNSLISDNNDLDKDIVDCVDLCHEHGKYNRDDSIMHHEIVQEPKANQRQFIATIFDIDNDREFDTLLENASNSKQSNYNSLNLLNISTIEKEQDLDVTQNYDYSRDTFCNADDCANSTNKLMKDNNKIMENGKTFVDERQNECEYVPETYESPTNYCVNNKTSETHIENILDDDNYMKSKDIDLTQQSDSAKNILGDVNDIQSTDIDLTQQSGSPEDTILCSPKTIEIPYEIGNEDISVAYDEICDRPNITGYCEETSLCEVNKSTGNDRSDLKDGVWSSSQYSEVFELSDNEFNYSINKHVEDNGSLEPRQAEFDIGGISIIDEFLHRNSLSRKSKLNCSCSSNKEPTAISNEIETCLPVVTLNSNKNLGNENFTLKNYEKLDNDNRKSKSCEEVEFVKISTPTKSKSDNNIVIAKTPKHDDYMIKTDQVTPMPNYDNMTSPEREEELDKFGIKPLKRKRAIQILTHIYNQTHPLMEIISNDDCSSPSKIRRINNVEAFPRRVIASEINCIVEEQASETPTHVLDTVEPNLSQTYSSPRKKSNQRNTVPECATSSSKENILYEETTSIPDIRNIECAPEDWIFQKREKAKVYSCRVPLHIAFHNYVSSRRSLREAILRYEPINIDDIHKGLVANGYRYNPKDLLRFMDRKCITVKTADNTRKNKNT